MLVTCNKCSIVFEAMSIDKVDKTCPTCANPDLVEMLDLTKPYHENLVDLARLQREHNDKS